MDGGHDVVGRGGALGPAGAVVAALTHNVWTFVTLANAGRLLTFDETTASTG
jgi:hypothetical protein